MRGLKLPYTGEYLNNKGRTLTGAWIETESPVTQGRGIKGRTLTGAWIETPSADEAGASAAVAPSRVRGLKPILQLSFRLFLSRTLTGAWIETGLTGSPSFLPLVAPSRVRGLKPCVTCHCYVRTKSHPHGCVD